MCKLAKNFTFPYLNGWPRSAILCVVGCHGCNFDLNDIQILTPQLFNLKLDQSTQLVKPISEVQSAWQNPIPTDNTFDNFGPQINDNEPPGVTAKITQSLWHLMTYSLIYINWTGLWDTHRYDTDTYDTPSGSSRDVLQPDITLREWKTN